MAGFRKAKPQQAALKMGIYGPAGSGKTMTALLIAEGLARLSGKRIAMVDTERGTDFYCQAVQSRSVHPEAFDFDALYTRSITECAAAIRGLKPDEHGVMIIDSITHIWQAAIEAYAGRQTSIGTIPMSAWGKIKRPYKDIMSMFLSSPMHAILCGRQGVEYSTNEDTEELKAIGLKMKAEGETPYEPHILIRMEAIKPKKTSERADIVAYVEKDRTGVLSGRSFVNPTFETLCVPLLGLLGATQADMGTLDGAASIDAEALAEAEKSRAEGSERLLANMSAKIALSDDAAALKKLGNEITPKLKASMLPEHVTSLREAYLARESELQRSSH